MTELLFKELTFAVIGAAMEVHRIMGPGFLEVVYQKALERELTLRGIPFEPQKKLAITYKDLLIGEYQADLVIDRKFIVEIKAVSTWNSRHDAQAVHYLTATGLQLALLLNFGTGSLQHRRVIRTGAAKEKSA
ncbi:MAG: GxxExxY protein [Chloroflexi bacterium]|nr:GxxExxY protein [Chloroflexota bacterium]